jgi:hypothetical protein
MSPPYQLQHLFPFIDLALLTPTCSATSLEGLKSKAFFGSEDPAILQEKLSTVSIVFVHPDGLDTWKSYLLAMANTSIQLFVLADSDYTMGHEHIDSLLEAFPTAQFWIQNWFGYHDRVKLLPIGVNGPVIVKRHRTKPLAISFFLQYPGYIHREEFCQFLETSPEIQPCCLPSVPYEAYCEKMSEYRFSCCPMGGGYDTLRFWESLMMGTIPVVKTHLFYEVLKLYYPDLPFLIVNDWNDLLSLDLSEELYNKRMSTANLDCLSLSFWIGQLPIPK